MRNPFEFLKKFPCPSKKTLLFMMAVVAAALLLSALISIWLDEVYNLHVPSVGTIYTIGVEAYGGDLELDEHGNQLINWSRIYPGISTNRSFYLRSKGNVDARLHLNTTNWDPIEISAYMNLTWDYNNTPISPGETIYVTLTLRTASDITFINYLITNNVEEFSFDITITAT